MMPFLIPPHRDIDTDGRARQDGAPAARPECETAASALEITPELLEAEERMREHVSRFGRPATAER